MTTLKTMTRREALRNMGLLAAGSFMLTNGFLSSCTQRTDKKRLVFYFTASGNSLYVAKHLSEKPISIPQVLQGDQLEFEADEIGLVFPDYQGKAPSIVQEFAQKVKLKAKYMFSVITYGLDNCLVTELWAEYAKQYNWEFNYINVVLMQDVYLPMFDQDQQRTLYDQKDEEGQIAKVVEDINSRREWIYEISPEAHQRGEMIMNMVSRNPIYPARSEQLLRIDEDLCIGCGTCLNVCPKKCFSYGNRGLTNNGECAYCLACANNCPQKAIKLVNREANPNARYRHPKITLPEIVRSNIQHS
ncbi:MAG: EFR1 family ferrodoxin [Bacteroidaceae bacterium]|nr:EFR1 family ferrodoxin [Bacteroidaceae bacterium]